MAWTDDRMDDLASQMAAGFERTDHEIGALRAEMREGFRDVRAEFKADIEALRTDVKGDIETLRGDFKTDNAALRTELKRDIEKSHTELRSDIAEMRSTMWRFGIGLLIGLFALVGTLIGMIVASPFGG